MKKNIFLILIFCFVFAGFIISVNAQVTTENPFYSPDWMPSSYDPLCPIGSTCYDLCPSGGVRCANGTCVTDVADCGVYNLGCPPSAPCDCGLLSPALGGSQECVVADPPGGIFCTEDTKDLCFSGPPPPIPSCGPGKNIIYGVCVDCGGTGQPCCDNVATACNSSGDMCKYSYSSGYYICVNTAFEINLKATVWSNTDRDVVWNSLEDVDGPVLVNYNAPYKLSFHALNVASCTLDGSSSGIDISGGTATPAYGWFNNYYSTGSRTHILSCLGTDGTIRSDSIVVAPPQPPTPLPSTCFGTTATINWTPVPGASSYQVLYWDSPFTAYSLQPPSATPPLIKTGLVPNATYNYQIMTFVTIPGGFSAYSNWSPWSSFSCVPATPPDLTAGPIPLNINVPINQSYPYTATISNIGGTPTGAPFRNIFQSSFSSTGSSPTTYDATNIMPALTAGGSAVTSRSITFPSANIRYMRVCADRSTAAYPPTTGVIPESNEGDASNCSPWRQFVISNPVPVVTFTANPIIMTLPTNSTTLTWLATNGATGCTASSNPLNSNWNGAKTVSNSNTTQTISGLTAGTKTFSLYCTNSSGNSPTITRNITVNISSPTLTVIKSGQGNVTSNPSGINCGSDCTEIYTNNTTYVTLTASAASGRIFTGWSVDGNTTTCPRGSGPTFTCSLTMDSSKTVTANFAIDPNYQEF